MSELTLLLLRIGFLVLLWFFVFAVVYSLRADLFGVKVRRMPEPARRGRAGARCPRLGATAPVAAAEAPLAAAAQGRARPPPHAVSRIVITSGPKAGLELPLGQRAAHDRALERVRASSSATTTPPATTRASCCGASSG